MGRGCYNFGAKYSVARLEVMDNVLTVFLDLEGFSPKRSISGVSKEAKLQMAGKLASETWNYIMTGLLRMPEFASMRPDPGLGTIISTDPLHAKLHLDAHYRGPEYPHTHRAYSYNITSDMIQKLMRSTNQFYEKIQSEPGYAKEISDELGKPGRDPDGIPVQVDFHRIVSRSKQPFPSKYTSGMQYALFSSNCTEAPPAAPANVAVAATATIATAAFGNAALLILLLLAAVVAVKVCRRPTKVAAPALKKRS